MVIAKDGKGSFGPWFVSGPGLFEGSYKNNHNQNLQIQEVCPQKEQIKCLYRGEREYKRKQGGKALRSSIVSFKTYCSSS